MKESTIIEVYKKTVEYGAAHSTCNKRQVGSALILPDGVMYTGANSSSDSCMAKGPDFCTRDDSVGDEEYLTCPSPCAEGTVILAALYDDKDVKGSILINTDFPCGRCRSIIIDTGIGELYFAAYKNHEPRLREGFYTDQMINAGVRVSRILKYRDIDGEIKHRVVKLKSYSRLASMAIRTPGGHYLRMLTDPEYREEQLMHIKNLKTLSGDAPEDVSVIARPLL